MPTKEFISKMTYVDGKDVNGNPITWAVPSDEGLIELIRCNDCQWWNAGKCENDNVLMRIEYDSGFLPAFKTNPDWFCADGVKK